MDSPRKPTIQRTLSEGALPRLQSSTEKLTPGEVGPSEEAVAKPQKSVNNVKAKDDVSLEEVVARPPTSVEEVQKQSKLIFVTRHMKTVQGILQVIQMVFCLVIFLCTVSLNPYDDCYIYYQQRVEYAMFVGSLSLVFTVLIFVAVITKLHGILKFGYMAETVLFVDFLLAVFHLISSLLLLILYCTNSNTTGRVAKAVAVFNVLAACCFIASGVMAYATRDTATQNST